MSGAPGSARTFLLHVGVGAVLLVAVASVAVLVSVRVGHDQALQQPVASGEVLAAQLVGPLVTQGVYKGDTKDLIVLNQRIAQRKAGSTIERVKVWSADGVILYSDDPRQIGLRYPLGADRSRVMTGRGVDSTVTDFSRPEEIYDQSFGRSLDVMAAARDTSGRPILVETYFTLDQEAGLTRRIVTVVLVPLLVLGLLLVPLAYSLARRMSRMGSNGGTPSDGPAIA